MKLKIYTDDILKEMSVFDIDKQMNIDIEQYRYDLKNKDFYLTSLKNKLSREDFMDKFIGESKSITKIAYELNVSKHLVYLLFTKYKIPKIGTKEFNEYKIEFLIKKFGQQIKFDFLVLCLNQKEIAEKYGISKYVLPEILKKLDLKTTVKATI
jgi:transposase